MKKYRISIERAKKNKLFYFVATTTIYRKSDGRCLILKRSKKEITQPGRWSVPGGKLEYDDLKNLTFTKKDNVAYQFNLVEKLVRRETKEECGLTIDKVTYLNDIVFVRPDNVPVVCVKFASMHKSGKVKIAPEFDDYAWVNNKEIKNYDVISNVIDEVKQTIKLFRMKK